ncbi:ATP-binding cassette domain-containing protein [Desulfovibrio aerotolerans]|uniref:ATP-binding cassette domain-containing protein n=1 Tax=Solidesulfovibrio aerotolerans TaxID=295255 RepID=A0A7C9IN06_9BACT|nr:ABC transporter ATP-binding protein [Solidesulfovibrio aerotolerans]MYL82819.1 ATP-binding cassette domain-containing protein [Solidesulfovibrio aerotolerans]
MATQAGLSPAAGPLIALTDVTRSYAMAGVVHTVLSGVTLSIDSGEFAAIMGPSGSGKSTLLHLLGLLDRPSAGSYRFAGRETATLCDDDLSTLRNQALGFVFQSFYLIPYATALDNVLLPGLYSNAPRAALTRRAMELLDKVGLAAQAQHKPSQLSGGQQQRVAVARALINDPDCILADEPTGQLDSATSVEIMELLATINRDAGKTVIVVTHEAATAAYARRQILVHDGRVA